MLNVRTLFDMTRGKGSVKIAEIVHGQVRVKLVSLFQVLERRFMINSRGLEGFQMTG